MKTFLEKALKSFREDGFEGCWYKPITEDLYVVIGYDDEDYLALKIAVNSDDLQCDFNWDWNMPYDDYDGVLDTSMTITNDTTIDDLLDHIAYWHFQLEDLKLDESGRIIK